MSNNPALDLLCRMRDAAQALSKENFSYASQAAGVKYIAYSVNGVQFYTDAQDIKEVSVCENLVVVPQTKRWMRGLVNSKGTLYSVSDLSLIAGYDQPTPTKTGHLLLVNDDASQCALLVNRVIGFRYFEDHMRTTNLDDHQENLDGLSAYVDEAYNAEGRDWYHLDVTKLLAAEQFREVQ